MVDSVHDKNSIIVVRHFRYHVWPKGHAPTNFAKWRTSTTPYKVKTLTSQYDLALFDINYKLKEKFYDTSKELKCT